MTHSFRGNIQTFGSIGIVSAGANTPGWMSNLSVEAVTTTNLRDSIKIASANGTALSATNVGYITLTDNGGNATPRIFAVTADVTILLSGAHWGIGGLGNVTGGLLRILAINDNTSLRWGVAYLGGRHIVLTTDTNATQTNITSAEHILCNTAVSSASNTCIEVGFIRADFTDSTDVWQQQGGNGDLVLGRHCDGIWQPWALSIGGFSSNPSGGTARWAQIGRTNHILYTASGNGTSNNTIFTLSLPSKARIATFDSVGGYAVNNGADLTSPIGVRCAANSVTLNLYVTPGGAAWTGGSTGKLANVNYVYEVGPAASFID